tara:strand:- start:61 stop:324 length:264 start_codon:yes stop_codon:yes gene_type:complete
MAQLLNGAFAADAAFDGYDARSAAAEKPRTLRISLGTEFAVHLVQARFLSFGQTTQDRCCGLRVNVEAWMCHRDCDTPCGIKGRGLM